MLLESSLESRRALVPDPAQTWWYSQRGRGLNTRTFALPAGGRVFVPFVLIQTVVTVSLNITLAVHSGDCMVILQMGAVILSILFMAYFAIESVRTENHYQCAARSPLNLKGPTSSTPLHLPERSCRIAPQAARIHADLGRLFADLRARAVGL